MSVGFIMLVHTAFDRAAQVARHLESHGSAVVIHIDKRVTPEDERRFRGILKRQPRIRLCKRVHCEWGTWSIVQATQAAAEMMLAEFPDAGHVYLLSGSCMPLRPVADLSTYLAAHPTTDFIESVTTSEVPWTLGGLESERFTLYFPFSWKSQRRLFDRAVALQRFLGIRRSPPAGLVPHLGSQWWCLSRGTLAAILADPDRPAFERYFKSLWIPDEAFFQTLVRRHSTRIESRSLTLTKFDFQGRPHVFYDDHLELLRRSDCFFARKIWPRADRLYQNFLTGRSQARASASPDPGKIDRMFAGAVERRRHGRPGLVMQSRFPLAEGERIQTAAPYSVFQGYSQIFDDFETWLTRATGSPAHGRLFHRQRVEFAGRARDAKGGLTADLGLRDYDATGFLRNLIWNTRGERQYFQYGPDDDRAVWAFMARDPNAQISVVSGAWAIDLFNSDRPFEETLREAARLQREEQAQIDIVQNPFARAKVRVKSLSEYLASPMEPLQAIIDEAMPSANPYLATAPRLTRLDGFSRFLQRLRNAGIRPYLAGTFAASPAEVEAETDTADPRAPAWAVQ